MRDSVCVRENEYEKESVKGCERVRVCERECVKKCERVCERECV